MVGTEKTFAMIKPDCYHIRNSMIELINDSNLFIIRNELTIQFTPELVEQFYSEHVGKSFFANLSDCMCEGQTLCLILEGDNAIRAWRDFIGPTNVNVACETAPNSIRAIFGDKTNTAKNAVHGSDSVESAEKEIKLIMNQNTNFIILPMKVKVNKAPVYFTDYLKLIEEGCADIDNVKIYELVKTDCTENDFDVGFIFDNIEDCQDGVNRLISLIHEGLSSTISKYDIFYDYLVNNYKYRDFVFQIICEKLEIHRDNIISNFSHYIKFNNDTEIELFMKVLRDWFILQNKEIGVFSMDIDCLLDDKITFTDTSPRSVILDMFYKIKNDIIV